MCSVGVHEDLQGKSHVPEAASQLKWLIPFSAAGEVEVVSKVEELWLAPLRTIWEVFRHTAVTTGLLWGLQENGVWQVSS